MAVTISGSGHNGNDAVSISRNKKNTLTIQMNGCEITLPTDKGDLTVQNVSGGTQIIIGKQHTSITHSMSCTDVHKHIADFLKRL